MEEIFRDNISAETVANCWYKSTLIAKPGTENAESSVETSPSNEVTTVDLASRIAALASTIQDDIVDNSNSLDANLAAMANAVGAGENPEELLENWVDLEDTEEVRQLHNDQIASITTTDVCLGLQSVESAYGRDEFSDDEEDEEEWEELWEETPLETLADIVDQLTALQVQTDSLGDDCSDVKKIIGEAAYKITPRYRRKKEESKQEKRLLDTRVTNFFRPQIPPN